MVRFLVLFILLIATAHAAAAQPGRPYDPQRLGQEQIARLVEGEEALLANGDVDGATALFERRLAAAVRADGEASLNVADLLSAFGAKLAEYAGVDDNPDLRRRALPYLARATAVYRRLFGADHPEVAIALNSWADVERSLNPDQPGPAEAALAEAYRIRLAALGPSNRETIWTMLYLSDVRGHPAMTGGDAARVEAVASLLAQAIAASRGSDPDTARGVPAVAYVRLARLHIRHGQAARAFETAETAFAAMPQEDDFTACLVLGDVMRELLAIPVTQATAVQRARLKRRVEADCTLDPDEQFVD